MELEYSISYEDEVRINQAIASGKRISLVTYVLGVEGESKLKFVLESILAQYGRIDLMEVLYTAAKELIANSTKAAIKRMIFQELNLNINVPSDYAIGMEKFKTYLNEQKFPAYRNKMREQNYFVKITVSHNKERLCLYVMNNFALLPVEEERVREKFIHAKQYDNLFEFFMKHGDNSEGAGMGITMVEILLSQSGFKRKNFHILSSPAANITIAKVTLPFMEPDSWTESSGLSFWAKEEQLISGMYSLDDVKKVMV